MGKNVRAKKHLGQHFLLDLTVAQRLCDAVDSTKTDQVLEIGPGMGVLTQYLLQRKEYVTTVCEIDTESVDYLREHYLDLNNRIISADFLKEDLPAWEKPIIIVGNFPYNISSQILFKVFENKDLVPQCVGMFQKEVAQRVASPPGSKAYGILSVLLQAFYDIEYLYTVPPDVFNPPPKVDSGVIKLTRNEVTDLGCDESLFKAVVKLAFNLRRKQLRNSLKSIFDKEEFPYAEKRPEQLSVEQFIEITLAAAAKAASNG